MQELTQELKEKLESILKATIDNSPILQSTESAIIEAMFESYLLGRKDISLKILPELLDIIDDLKDQINTENLINK